MAKSKSMHKTISWLGVSAVLITGCAWLECGSLLLAAKAAFWACLFKTPVFWMHETIWERRGRPATARKRVPLPVLCACCAA